MADQTITGADPQDGAVATAQPVEGAQPTAAQPTEPQASQQPSPGDENFDYESWLQQKGVDPSTPEGKAAIAKSWRGMEQKMHASTMQASQLRQSLTPSEPQLPTEDGDPGQAMVQEMYSDWKRTQTINGFKDSHPDWNQHEPAMVQILNQPSPSGYSYKQLVNAGVIGLETVYAMAKGSNPENTEQVRTQAQQEVLQTLANTQRAGGGTAQASNSNPQAPSNDPVMAAIKAARG